MLSDVNKKLIPIKAHYFFFNGGVATLSPYLSTYARQLGFDSSTVGLIYTVLPISGLIAKPIFGILADRYKSQKLLITCFQILTLISYAVIYFVPQNNSTSFDEQTNSHNESLASRTNKAISHVEFDQRTDGIGRNTKSSPAFWMFLSLMIANWIGQAVVVSVTDAVCFNILGSNKKDFGRQRLWGSLGWGIFSLLSGILVDVVSKEEEMKKYYPSFLLMAVLLTIDVIAIQFIRVEADKSSPNIIKDVTYVIKSPTAIAFFSWTIAGGISTGLVWNFLSWLIEDMFTIAEDRVDNTKTLQGLVSAFQTFFGDIPAMFFSGYFISRFGHTAIMSTVLFFFGIRFIIYSFLMSPWWILPIEILHGPTYGISYPLMASYADKIACAGTETTLQGLVGAIFEGVGTSLGSALGGVFYDRYSGWITYRIFGIVSLCFCFIHVITMCLLAKSRKSGRNER